MRAGCRKSARPVRRAGGGNVTTRETEAPALCESQSANGYSLRLRSARCPSTLRPDVLLDQNLAGSHSTLATTPNYHPTRRHYAVRLIGGSPTSQHQERLSDATMDDTRVPNPRSQCRLWGGTSQFVCRRMSTAQASAPTASIVLEALAFRTRRSALGDSSNTTIPPLCIAHSHSQSIPVHSQAACLDRPSRNAPLRMTKRAVRP